MDYSKQVGKTHYNFDRYFFPGRWMSYWYQTKEIATRPDIKKVLDIGPGTAFLKHILNIHRPDILYKTLDVANDVKPDIIASVTDLPLPNNSFDCVCAFQVLEHIKFEDFEVALNEMKRVSSKYVMVSLPHFGPSIELNFKLPFLKRVKLAAKFPYHPAHTFNGQHYWELGKKGYDIKKIRTILRRKFTMLADYVPFENQYHHFFVMEIK